jgi:hypothetical protein
MRLQSRLPPWLHEAEKQAVALTESWLALVDYDKHAKRWDAAAD